MAATCDKLSPDFAGEKLPHTTRPSCDIREEIELWYNGAE